MSPHSLENEQCDMENGVSDVFPWS